MELYLKIILATIMLVIAIYDYKFRIIPDYFNILIVVIGVINILLSYLLMNQEIYKENIYTGIICFCVLGFVFFITKGQIGFGDVKLLSALGFCIGYQAIFFISTVSFVCCGLVGLIMLLMKKGIKTDIPFIPFVFIGTICYFSVI